MFSHYLPQISVFQSEIIYIYLCIANDSLQKIQTKSNAKDKLLFLTVHSIKNSSHTGMY